MTFPRADYQPARRLIPTMRVVVESFLGLVGIFLIAWAAYGQNVGGTGGGGGGGGGGLSVTDQAAFTQGTSQFTPSGGVYNDSATLSSGQQGTARLTAARELHTSDTTTQNLIQQPIPALAETTCTTNSYSPGANAPVNGNLNGALCVTTQGSDIRPASGSITAQDTASSTATGFRGAAQITGTPTTGSIYPAGTGLAVNASGIAHFQLSNTWTGTVAFEESIDQGTTWQAAGCHVESTNFDGSSVTGNGIFACLVSGGTNIRARGTAAWTGTATVTLTVSATQEAVRVLSIPSPATPFRLIAANNTNSTEIKASPGFVASYQLGNISASTAYWLKFYDTATAPTCGSGTPVKQLIIPPVNSGNNAAVSLGVAFLNGIGICVTGGIADADTTAVAVNTVVVNIDYK